MKKINPCHHHKHAYKQNEIFRNPSQTVCNTMKCETPPVAFLQLMSLPSFSQLILPLWPQAWNLAQGGPSRSDLRKEPSPHHTGLCPEGTSFTLPYLSPEPASTCSLYFFRSPSLGLNIQSHFLDRPFRNENRSPFSRNRPSGAGGGGKRTVAGALGGPIPARFRFVLKTMSHLCIL